MVSGEQSSSSSPEKKVNISNTQESKERREEQPLRAGGLPRAVLGGVSNTFQAPGQAAPAGSQSALSAGKVASHWLSTVESLLAHLQWLRLGCLTEDNPMARARQEGTSGHMLPVLTTALLVSRPLAAPPNSNIHFHQNIRGGALSETDSFRLLSQAGLTGAHRVI